jgi:hypothetical protein
LIHNNAAAQAGSVLIPSTGNADPVFIPIKGTHIMRINSKIVFDIETLEVLERECYEYDGPIAHAKGDQVAQGAEQSQANFATTLQNAFSANNAAQTNDLNFLNNKMQAAINNPTGYSPQTLASMRAQANDQVAAQDQNVTRAVQNSEDTRGGAEALPSGVNSQIDASIQSQAAQAGNAAQQNITEQNANLQNQNMWNAVQTEDAVAGQENPEGMAGEEEGSANSVSNLSNSVTSSAGPTAGQLLAGVAGAGLGAVGSYFGAQKGCWIAASFFGWDSPKTIYLREWLNTLSPSWFRKFYLKYGERIAVTPARWLFRPIFAVVLRNKQ